MADDDRNFLPADWEDNDRMNFMFSAFPESREVNPKHWDSKLHFWTKLILDSCKCNDGVCIDLATLQRRFSRNGLTPLGLNTVINEMLKDGKLQRKEDFVKCDNEGWMAWSFGLAKKSFWWGTRTIFGRDGNDGSDNGQFVVVNLAKEKATWILAQHHKKADNETVDCVIPWNVLKMQCSCEDHVCNDDTLELVIGDLQKQGKVALFTTSEGEKVVKLARKGQQFVDPVSQTDVEVMRVRKTMANLTLRSRKLTNEIESCRLKAVSFAKEGSRRMALKLLKKKQMQQKALEETLSSLNSLEEILQRIQSGKTNQMVFEALKSGTVALKGTQEGLDIETVDDVMDDLNETLNRSEDIHAAISEGNARIAETSGVGDEELGDLERELASLAIGNKDAVSATQAGVSQDEAISTALPSEFSPIPKQPSKHPFVGVESNGSNSRLLGFPDTPKEMPEKVKGPGTKDLSRQLNRAQLVG